MKLSAGLLQLAAKRGQAALVCDTRGCTGRNSNQIESNNLKEARLKLGLGQSEAKSF